MNNKMVCCTWSIRITEVECSKSNPKKQQVPHVAACLCPVFPGLKGCKLQWEWAIITDLWTTISLMVTLSPETKGYSKALPFFTMLIIGSQLPLIIFRRNQV